MYHWSAGLQAEVVWAWCWLCTGLVCSWALSQVPSWTAGSNPIPGQGVRWWLSGGCWWELQRRDECPVACQRTPVIQRVWIISYKYPICIFISTRRLGLCFPYGSRRAIWEVALFNGQDSWVLFPAWALTCCVIWDSSIPLAVPQLAQLPGLGSTLLPPSSPWQTRSMSHFSPRDKHCGKLATFFWISKYCWNWRWGKSWWHFGETASFFKQV